MGPIERFCLVGLGAHARSKLAPALRANGQSLVGVVTQRPDHAPAGAAVYPALAAALGALPADVAFILATPPAAHFHQARAVAAAGRDLFVEKPAFVAAAQAAEIARLYGAGPALVGEGFMHRHTALQARLLALWAARRPRIRRLEMVFLIPAMPPGTFRREGGVASSCLYDIGCYPLALMGDLGLEPGALNLAGPDFAGDPDRERIRLAGVAQGIEIAVDIGVAPAYANHVLVELEDAETLRFAPFFYGRASQRSITSSRGPVETFDDPDAFAAMFRTPREAWLADQPARLAAMVAVAAALERLGEQLQTARSGAGGAAPGLGAGAAKL